jgi:two-component system, sensor histidine kinase and response regulator
MNKEIQHQTCPNIVIVDDTPANLTLLGNILKKEGYKVRPVLDGKMALQTISNEKPDLILLDIMMPGMSGYEVCRTLKNDPELQHIPVIFISALNDEKDIVKAFYNGGVDYIAKPFKSEEVIARVTTHLKLVFQRKELLRLNATKDKFFSIIAHDLRNPFNAFLNVSELLYNDFTSMDKETIQELLTMQLNSAKQTFSLLQNLLEWSKTQRENITLNLLPINLHKITTECRSLYEITSKKKNITVDISVPEEVTITTDNDLLNTVLRNLLANALKFTHEGGHIVIGATIKESFVEISVSDNGIGIPADVLPNLFRIDRKVATSGTANESGSGLGLILCKEFVALLGGTIDVESEAGEGSVFKFTLPM